MIVGESMLFLVYFLVWIFLMATTVKMTIESHNIIEWFVAVAIAVGFSMIYVWLMLRNLDSVVELVSRYIT